MSGNAHSDAGSLELADLLNTILDKGVVLHGDVTLAVADVDLVKLNLGLLLAAIVTVEQRSRGASVQGLANALGPPALSAVAPEAPLPDAAVEMSTEDVPRVLPERINTDPDRVESGLARLVLTLIEVLRKVLEHQAIRRMDGGGLSPQEIERLGLALARLSDRMEDLKRVFGLADEDLQIDLGPLGRVR